MDFKDIVDSAADTVVAHEIKAAGVMDVLRDPRLYGGLGGAALGGGASYLLSDDKDTERGKRRAMRNAILGAVAGGGAGYAGTALGKAMASDTPAELRPLTKDRDPLAASPNRAPKTMTPAETLARSKLGDKGYEAAEKFREQQPGGWESLTRFLSGGKVGVRDLGRYGATGLIARDMALDGKALGAKPLVEGLGRATAPAEVNQWVKHKLFGSERLGSGGARSILRQYRSLGEQMSKDPAGASVMSEVGINRATRPTVFADIVTKLKQKKLEKLTQPDARIAVQTGAMKDFGKQRAKWFKMKPEQRAQTPFPSVENYRSKALTGHKSKLDELHKALLEPTKDKGGTRRWTSAESKVKIQEAMKDPNFRGKLSDAAAEYKATRNVKALRKFQALMMVALMRKEIGGAMEPGLKWLAERPIGEALDNPLTRALDNPLTRAIGGYEE
jgi:hypothetical protein